MATEQQETTYTAAEVAALQELQSRDQKLRNTK